MRRPPLPALTSLRFFAAAIVLVYHVFSPNPSRGFLQGLAASGTEAVTFFFILSGFILVYVYSGADPQSAMNMPARVFWRARFARLAPGYLAGLLIAAPILLYTVFVLKSVTLPTFLLSLLLVPLFLQAWLPSTIFAWNVPAWSVSIEMFFYALFPFLEKRAHILSPLRLLLVAIALVFAVDLLKAELRPQAGTPAEAWNIMYFPPMHLSFFILGMALCRVFLFGPSLSTAFLRFLFAGGAMLSLGLLGFRAFLPSWCIHDSMLSLAFGCLIFGGARQSDKWLLGSRPMLLLGEASYSLYITHYPLMFLWRSVLRHLPYFPTWLGDWAFCVLAVVFSVLLYIFVERAWRPHLLGLTPHRDAPVVP